MITWDPATAMPILSTLAIVLVSLGGLAGAVVGYVVARGEYRYSVERWEKSHRQKFDRKKKYTGTERFWFWPARLHAIIIPFFVIVGAVAVFLACIHILALVAGVVMILCAGAFAKADFDFFGGR